MTNLAKHNQMFEFIYIPFFFADNLQEGGNLDDSGIVGVNLPPEVK